MQEMFCAICQSADVDDVTLMDTCTHVFCYWCITKWFRKQYVREQPWCPMCHIKPRVLKHRFDVTAGMPLTFDTPGECVRVRRRSAAVKKTAAVIDYSRFERIQVSDDEDQQIPLATYLEQEHQRRLEENYRLKQIREQAQERRRQKVERQRRTKEQVKQRVLQDREHDQRVVRAVPSRNIAARAYSGLQALGRLHRKKFHAADFIMAISWCGIWQSFVSSIPPTVTSVPLSRGTGVVLLQAPMLSWAAFARLLFRQVYDYVLPHSAVLVFYTINRAGDATQDRFFRKVYRFLRAVYVVCLLLSAIFSHTSYPGSVTKAVRTAYFILSTIAQWDAMELAPVSILATVVSYLCG